MDVDSSGSLTVTSNGINGTIQFSSQAQNNDYTCGLLVPHANGSAQQLSPICGFKLSSPSSVMIQPIDQIFLMWATSKYDRGVWMEKSLGCGILVALSSEATRPVVTYGEKIGWSANGAKWAKLYQNCPEDLKKILVLPPEHNQPRLFKRI